MYCDGDIVEINDTYRLKIEQDHSAENPLDWDWPTEIHEIDNYRTWMGWEHPEGGVPYAAWEYHQRVRRGYWTSEQRDRAIHLYMVAVGDDRAFSVEEWRGYSKGDWATCLVLWDADEGGSVYDSWAAWRRGDVYGVTEQILDEEDDEWEDGECIWGNYFDAMYSPEDVAREHFENYPRCHECGTPQSVTQGKYQHKLDCSKAEVTE